MTRPNYVVFPIKGETALFIAAISHSLTCLGSKCWVARCTYIAASVELVTATAIEPHPLDGDPHGEYATIWPLEMGWVRDRDEAIRVARASICRDQRERDRAGIITGRLTLAEYQGRWPGAPWP